MSVTVTDEQIDACGFRMFDLHEIASTMVMDEHPSGGDYVVLGNKRERMMQYGNAVTPPVMQFLMSRVVEVLGGGATFKDLFCGAGGSSIGAEKAGGHLVLGLNHWRRAIETHSENFPHADHDCADVSALTTAQIRRYPDSDILLASPECTNHSPAKGALRKKPTASSVYEDGPAGTDEQDRSRATMWDVVRFAEQKILKGSPYRAIIVENVVDAYKWGADDNGGLFAAWRMALANLGYQSEIVWLNSMFCWPTPQSRDRMYVVFWQKGVTKPNLKVEPVSWCPSCELVVNGRQTWKNPERKLLTAAGTPTGAKYGGQYLYCCPDCHSPVLPGVFPAASAIDWTLEAPIIGDRARPLAANTRERIRRGLERLASEPFQIRISGEGYGANPKPLTLPVITLTGRHDMAMVIPVAGNTFERTPGNRARDAQLQPHDVVHGTLDRAMVLPNRANNVGKDAETDPAPPVMTGGTIGIVRFRQHGTVTPIHETTGTVSADGNHHGLVMRNNNGGAEMSTPSHEPFRTLTGRCHQSLVIPYQSVSRQPETEPSPTVMPRDRLALLIPPSNEGVARDPHLEPTVAAVTQTRPALVELP